MLRTVVPALMALLISVSSAQAQTLPAELVDPLADAYSTGNGYVITAVMARLKADYPQFASTIDVYGKSPQHAKAVAAPKAEEKKSPWSGTVDLGISVADGNTDEKNLNFNAEANYEVEHWKHTAYAKARNQQSQNIRTNEEYAFGGKSRYKLSDIDYVFADVEYVKDRFSGYDYRITETVGYGRKFYDTEDFKFSADASIGAQHLKEDVPNAKTETSFVQKLSSDLEWKITEALSLENKNQATFSPDLIVSEVDIYLKSKIADALSLKAGVEIDHLSDVPANRKKSDILSILKLAYEY